MGGYQTLPELYETLDDMHDKFPNIITARMPISDTIVTHEGRQIFYVKISDNPNMDEDEPEVLYTSLHHSREPNGMSQLLFYMWHILENYPSDPVAKYLVEEAELYFVPCVNPDGYVYNNVNDPDGGGLWRKNRRDNLDGTFGVDLNRNYGYEWGHDNSGSSPNTNSQTYRGPSAFSEPETRSMRDFCLEHEFRIGLNYHTFGNLLIWPWAYSDALAEPGLKILGDQIAKENNYHGGTTTETVGYAVNGSSDDWMFGGADIYSYTPEVGPGTFGFWPTADTIDGLNKANVTANINTALIALNYVEAYDADDGSFNLDNPVLPIGVRRLGFEPGDVTVSLTALNSSVLSTSPPVNLFLDQFEEVDTSFMVWFDNSVQNGEEIVFVLEVNNGSYTLTDTIRKFINGPTIPLFEEPGDNLNNWVGPWGLSDDVFLSAPSSITDSPNGNYAADNVSELVTNSFFIPQDAMNPTLRFWTRFEIENNYDYVTVEAREPGASTFLCGRYTNPGSNNQLFGVPLYDGVQGPDWVQECMDLNDFKGKIVSIAFTIVTDGFVEFDGFYFDDLEVSFADPNFVATDLVNHTIPLFILSPNPAGSHTTLSWEDRSENPVTHYQVVNALGKVVEEDAYHVSAPIRLETESWPTGTYFVRLTTQNGTVSTKKLVVE